VRELSAFDFSFDLCVRHHQLPAVIELVRRCPEVRFVLDHCGKPAIRERVLDPWRRHIRELAALPNARCKISGLLTEADLADWRPRDLTADRASCAREFRTRTRHAGHGLAGAAAGLAS
jgi:L-fuconolactonase